MKNKILIIALKQIKIVLIYHAIFLLIIYTFFVYFYLIILIFLGQLKYFQISKSIQIFNRKIYYNNKKLKNILFSILFENICRNVFRDNTINKLKTKIQVRVKISKKQLFYSYLYQNKYQLLLKYRKNEYKKN